MPVAPGGSSDFVGRAVCERWGRTLGQPFVIDNLGGGGGVIAALTTLRAPPDGYTLLQGYVATHGTSPATRRLPYDAVTDFTPIGMIGGQTQAMFPSLAAALPNIRSGRVKALAVTGRRRQPTLKDVPTMIESGLEGVDAVQWYGVVGPAGLPTALVTRLNETLNATLRAPDMRERLFAEAVDPTPMTPAEFGEHIRAEVARWSALAKERRIEVED